ncbi:MAG: PD-(D/E)XK nuclease family protein [Bacteroidales bacterium]|nr:PD-(D/E)XK nuclease family protein [Bacteroidales bacterium]
MAFIKKISDYITSHYNLTKENITIVFPNKRAALQLRTELAKTIKTNFWVPQILSIQQAMEEWSGLQLIDNIEIIFEIIKMNQEFFPYAAQMAKDFDEIDQYGVNAENLFAHLKDAKEIEEWNLSLESSVESNYLKFFGSLLSYYNNLCNTLQKNGQGYYGLITKKIASFDDATLKKCTRGRKIIFAGFNALTTTEENIIVRMVESGNAVMLWDLDRYYFEDEKQEAGFFARKFFKKHPNIEKNFIDDSFLTQEKRINIVSVSGNAVQTNALQLMLEKDKEDKRRVIVLADESLLIPVLNSIPESCGNIQVTMGYPFDKTIVYHFVDQLFRYQNTLSDEENKNYLWTFIRFCNSDFIKLIFKGLEYNKLNAWLMNMAKNSVYYFKKSDLKQFEEYKALHDILNLATKKWNNTKECLNSLKDILLVSMTKLGKDDNFVRNQISVAGRIVNRIDLLLNKYSKFIKILDLQMLYAQVASQMSINLQGDKEGLQIMGLLETRNLDFDTIHFLSVNEGVLPQNKNNNSLIPFDLRKAYGLPTYDQQQAVYSYHFYRLLQNAKNINLYYNNLADSAGSGMGEPSRFVRQLEYEYAKKNIKVKLEYKQYKNPIIKNLESKIVVKKTDGTLNKIQRLSPTSIGAYVRCPLQFYWKHVEKIEDKSPDEEIQVNVVGSIIHGTLEHFYKLFKEDEIISLQLFDEMYKNQFDKCYHKSLIDNKFSDGLPDSGFNCLSKIVINKMLADFIKNERKFIEDGNQMSIISTEKELKKYIDFQGHNIELYGKADRIDKVNGEIRIIDYKTGKVNPYDLKISDKVDGITDMAEKSIQLLMYKYLYLNDNPKTDPDTVCPSIIGFQKLSHGVYNLEINELLDLSKSFKKTCDKYFNDFLTELYDKDIPFTQTENVKNCSFCDFKNICKRG